MNDAKWEYTTFDGCDLALVAQLLNFREEEGWSLVHLTEERMPVDPQSNEAKYRAWNSRFICLLKRKKASGE